MLKHILVAVDGSDHAQVIPLMRSAVWRVNEIVE